MSRQIAGWKLASSERESLLRRVPPRYARTIADHITLRFGTDSETLLPTSNEGEIIGEADDRSGVQALVVRIGGTAERGDGSHLHITWTLAPGREARESNQVIQYHGWKTIEMPIMMRLQPARWTR